MSQRNTEKKSSDWSYILRLLQYAKGETGLFVIIVLSLIVYGFTQAYSPTLIAQAIDGHITKGDYQGLVKKLIFLLVVYIATLLSFRFQLIALGKLGQKVLVKLRLSIFNRLELLGLDFYHENKPGDLMSRLINDTSNVGTLFSQSIAQTLGSLVSLIAVVIAMFLLDWRLAASTFLVIPMMVWLTFYFSKKSRIAFQRSTKSLGTLSTTIEEELRLIRESQSFAREALSIENFEADNIDNRNANIEAIRITAAFSPSIDILSTISQVIVIVFGGLLALKGHTTVGVLVAFLAYVQRFYRPIQMLSTFYTQLQSTLASAERIFAIIDSPPEDLHPEERIDINEMQGIVEFKNVQFGYDLNQPILRSISFKAEPGKSIAFIGETGVGKSTCISLIPRYYLVDSGEISIDGLNVNEASLPTLRKFIAEVPQSSFLFSDTIANNISFGDPKPDHQRIIDAAKAVQIHQIIENFPEAYNTQLGAKGVHLSQGEQQLLCIARAIYAKPKILLLDEATSSIDSHTENLVQQAIEQLMSDRTSFIIAHRLSTIKNVDTIIVLGKDGILEQGSHEVLMQKDGYYKKIIEENFE